MPSNTRKKEALPPRVSAIHALIGMSPDEVDAELLARGKTSKDVVREFEKLNKKLWSEFSDLDKRASRLEGARHGKGGRENFQLDPPAKVARTLDDGPARMAPIVLQENGRLRRGLHFVAAPTSDDIEEECQRNEVLLDTLSEPQDGDVVLTWTANGGRRLCRFRHEVDGLVSLEDVAGGLDAKSVGHPSTFVIYGVAIAMRR